MRKFPSAWPIPGLDKPGERFRGIVQKRCKRGGFVQTEGQEVYFPSGTFEPGDAVTFAIAANPIQGTLAAHSLKFEEVGNEG